MWAIDPWSRLSQQQVVRSPEFGLAGSERTWMLSYTRDKSGFHLTCVGEASSTMYYTKQNEQDSACVAAQSTPACQQSHAVQHPRQTGCHLTNLHLRSRTLQVR